MVALASPTTTVGMPGIPGVSSGVAGKLADEALDVPPALVAVEVKV
jgi:hypothetical protein